ncbi:response regulator [Candidatus Kuenenia sp.]|uniref:response regulator transcription factor n=1 Tax=Candidatus Kuenenia sp. TaxID=2499824 RepID=UPI003220698B
MIKKILIVDDSIVARLGVKNCILKEASYEIYEAFDGFMGVGEFKRVSPDLTFMDITMPVMSGIQALEEIKKIDKNALVIVITADVQLKTIEKVKGLGALTLLRKPPKKEDIINAIAKAREIQESKEKK